jgi:hypothetical protein
LAWPREPAAQWESSTAAVGSGDGWGRGRSSVHLLGDGDGAEALGLGCEVVEQQEPQEQATAMELYPASTLCAPREVGE